MLLVVFAGDTHALIPLYSVGVFVSFTISQAGMVVHWRRERSPGWRKRALLNGTGCVLTALVAVIVTVAKAPDSLLVAIIIPILVLMMVFIYTQYQASTRALAVRPDATIPGPRREERVVVPVAGIDRATVQAVNVARSIAPDVMAILVSDDTEEIEAVRTRWQRQLPDVPLVVVESPYRALVGPLLTYLDVLDDSWPDGRERPITFVVIPEYVARHWWERLLYNQSARRLRQALLGRTLTVVVNVPYRRESTGAIQVG